MIVKLKHRRSGPHVIVDVFTGEDRTHLALAGTLTFDVGQWQLFGAALKLGAGLAHGHLEVVFEDHEAHPVTKYDSGC